MSVPTVASLCAALGHHLAPVPGFSAPDVEVTAVHISELDDPNPYLSGGELLLTTGLVLPRSRLGARRYVDRLLEANISALGFGVGPVHHQVPVSLIEACRAAGLPLLVVPGPTPFTLISRSYWQALSRATEEQLTDAVAAHRAMVDAAASADPRSAMLRRLAAVLDGWAALLGATGEVVQAFPLSAADDLGALRTEVVRLEAAGPHSSVSFTLAGHVVVVFPLAVRDRVVGYLAVGSPRGLDQGQRRIVLTAAALLSLDAMRDAHSESAAEVVRRCLALLVDLGDTEAARHLAAATAGPAVGREVCVLVTRGGDSTVLVRSVLRWCPDALPVRTDERCAWFLLPATHADADPLTAQLRAVDPTVVAVLSEPVGVDRAGRVRAQAHRRAEALAPGTVVLPRWRPIGADIDVAVGGLLAHVPPSVVDALVAYLRYRGQWEQAARALEVHRNTLRYRVARARAVLGLDLDDPDVAAQTWLALRDRDVT